MAAALWLVQHDPSARGYLHTSQSVNCGESLEKDDTWKSETKMLQEWIWEELQAHLGSGPGRTLWKEDEYTPGVYVYKDTQSWKRLTTAKRNKKWQMGQEQERDDENLGKFKQLYDQEALALGTSASSWEGNTAAIALKGLGKGKGLEKGKGLGASLPWRMVMLMILLLHRRTLRRKPRRLRRKPEKAEMQPLLQWKALKRPWERPRRS